MCHRRSQRYLLSQIFLAFEAEGTLLAMSLNEVSSLNTADLNCENTSMEQFVQLQENLGAWADILDHRDDIQKDIDTLKQIEVILLQTKKQTQKKSTPHLYSRDLPVSAQVNQPSHNQKTQIARPSSNLQQNWPGPL